MIPPGALSPTDDKWLAGLPFVYVHCFLLLFYYFCCFFLPSVRCFFQTNGLLFSVGQLRSFRNASSFQYIPTSYFFFFFKSFLFLYARSTGIYSPKWTTFSSIFPPRLYSPFMYIMTRKWPLAKAVYIEHQNLITPQHPPVYHHRPVCLHIRLLHLTYNAPTIKMSWKLCAFFYCKWLGGCCWNLFAFSSYTTFIDFILARGFFLRIMNNALIFIHSNMLASSKIITSAQYRYGAPLKLLGLSTTLNWTGLFILFFANMCDSPYIKMQWAV